jgi:HAD superfamily hydrolase (TIGR01490 family)
VNPPKFAFFNVDGTLIQGNTWTGVLAYPKINRLKLWRMQLVDLTRAATHELKLLGQARYRAGYIRSLAALVRGWPEEEVQALFHWLATDYLASRYRPDVLDLVQEHRSNGTQIVLISAIFKETLSEISRVVGADSVIGTSLAFKNGLATGRIKGKACVGLRKIDLIRIYLRKQNPSVDLSECIGYASSYSDAPLLAAMGLGVAVYPDPLLEVVAIEQRWPIFPAS